MNNEFFLLPIHKCISGGEIMGRRFRSNKSYVVIADQPAPSAMYPPEQARTCLLPAPIRSRKAVESFRPVNLGGRQISGALRPFPFWNRGVRRCLVASIRYPANALALFQPTAQFRDLAAQNCILLGADFGHELLGAELAVSTGV